MKEELLQKYLGLKSNSTVWYNNVLELEKMVADTLTTPKAETTAKYWNLYARIMFPSPEVHYVGYSTNFNSTKLKDDLPIFA